MDEPRITFSRHAEEVLVERKIDRTWIELTIRTPDAVEPDPNRPEIRRAFRSIPERNSRVLRVAYVARGNQVHVIAVFFDRARRRR
jgi:hypothetical protein